MKRKRVFFCFTAKYSNESILLFAFFPTGLKTPVTAGSQQIYHERSYDYAARPNWQPDDNAV